MRILDVGCGNNKFIGKNKRDEVIGVDFSSLDGVDIVHNLNNFPWPFKDNEFDKIVCRQVLEHLDNLEKTLEEFRRISKNHACVIIEVPIFTSSNAVNDPTHKLFFTIKTFEHYSGERKRHYSKDWFIIKKKKIVFHKVLFLFEMFFNLGDFFQRLHNSFFCFFIPAVGINLELEVKK